MGELEKAEDHLLFILKNAKTRKVDWFAAACSNLCMLSIRLNRKKDTVIKHAKDGLEVATYLYSKDTPEVNMNDRC